MKILLLSDSILRPSGVGRHVCTLAKFLVKNGFEVSILTEKTGRHFVMDGVNVLESLRVRSDGSLYGLYNYTYENLHIRKIIEQNGDAFDIIHYHGLRHLHMHSIKNETPILTTLHNFFPACIMHTHIHERCEKPSSIRCSICYMRKKPRHSIVAPLIVPYCHFFYKSMKKSLAKMRKVICVSEYIKRALRQSFSLKNIVTIYNFIDSEELLKSDWLSDFNLKRFLKIPESSRIIVYFGRLSPEKGVDTLINAFKIVQNSLGSNDYLLIGGEGSEKQLLENLSKSVNNVIFTGWLSRERQLSTLVQSDIFVHPSSYPDACPTAILEAMALGLPVVATNTGGIPELVVNGKSGYLVKPRSICELAEKIIKILENEDFRVRARKSNVAWSHKFDIKTIGPKIVKIYESIADNVDKNPVNLGV